MGNVAIVGYADRGLFFDPVLLHSEYDGRLRFGGELAEAASLALRAGADGIVVVRIPFCDAWHELYLSLGMAYDLLEAAHFDIITVLPIRYGHLSTPLYTYEQLSGIQRTVPCRLSQRLCDLSMYYDAGIPAPSHNPFLWQLIEFLVVRGAHNEPAHAVVSIDMDMFGDDITSWTVANQPDFAITVAGQLLDVGAYLSIVANAILYSVDDRLLSFSAAPSYAGLIASLPYSVTPTNKTIHGINAIYPAPYSHDALRISASGFVILVDDVHNGFVPFSAVTAAHQVNAGRHVINSRLVAGIKRSLIDALHSYTRGHGVNVNMDTLVESAVAQALAPYIESGAIYHYIYDYQRQGPIIDLSIDAYRHGELQGMRIYVSESVI
ncbi:MAG TPA: hypothetical protein GX530_10285 [Corynebacteriales bacterium]|nr:hypothetical protein [Mycobacteriales bacterium]